MKKKILSLLVLLTAAVSGAWADELQTEYTSDAQLNAVTVSASMEVTISSGATVTINKGLVIEDNVTLTVNGPGTLVVNGTNVSVPGQTGSTGSTGTQGGQGGQGGAAISGNIIIKGATVNATGGSGGKGGIGGSGWSGAGGQGGQGGQGGAAFDGAVTIFSGTISAKGGTGGDGGTGGEGVDPGSPASFIQADQGPGGDSGYAFAGTLTFYGGTVNTIGSIPGYGKPEGNASNAFVNPVTMKATTYELKGGYYSASDVIELANIQNYRNVNITAADYVEAATDYELTVYDSKAISNSSIPFYGSYMNNYTRNEMLYPAAELADMSGADITSLTFYKTSDITESWGAASFKIYLMEVSNSTLSAYIGMTGATVVYEGSVDATGGERPVTINFTTPYRYNGGNLLVGVYQTVKGSNSIAAFYVQLADEVSSGSYDSEDAASAPFSQQYGLPKTTFTYKPAPFDYEFTDVATDHGSGQVKFFIGSKEVEGAYEADEGKTVTVTVAPDEGWIVDEDNVTAEVYRYWEGSRRAAAMIPMQRTVTLTHVSTDANGVATYTFVMPASNVRVAPKYLKSSTLYFDPAEKTNLMKVKVGTTVRNVEDSKTVKIEKVEKVTEGTPVKLTANTGYKFRKVEVKKGGGTKILTIGTRQLTYVEGETWKDAIDNHPTENTGWMYYNSDVYNGSNKLYYSGWNSLDANTAVDSSKSYIFYE